MLFWIASGLADEAVSLFTLHGLGTIALSSFMDRPKGPARSESLRTAQSGKRSLAVGFLLLDGFDLHAFAGCVEALALANLDSGDPVYQWRILGTNAKGVRSRCGLLLPVEDAFEVVQSFDRMIVIAGAEAATGRDGKTLGWLRQLARNRTAFGAIEGGVWPLALAGLAAHHRVAAHWQCRAALRETFADFEVTNDRYVLDGDMASAVGGIAAFEMMVEWIRSDCGDALADSIAASQASTMVPILRGRPLLGLAQRMGLSNPHLVACLAIIEEHVETPLRSAELAGRVGISKRHLERLFRNHINITPRQLYMQVRLAEAKHLIEQTQMSVAQIAVTAGFVSASHFARSFRDAFGRSPRQFRTKSHRAIVGETPHMVL